MFTLCYITQNMKLLKAKQKDEISQLMAQCREIYGQQDTTRAQATISKARRIEDHCDGQFAALIRMEADDEPLVSDALCYRYCCKLVVSHTLNIVTSIVQPLQKFDYAA